MVGTQLAIWIGSVVGATLRSRPASRVHGGSINECYRWESSAGPIFVKVAPARVSAMLAAEAAGLEELRRADAVRVPRVLGVSTGAAVGAGAAADGGIGAGVGGGAGAGVGVGSSSSKAWLALEWIEGGVSSHATDSILGEQLARQHRATRTDFGWSRDNTIGSTPQLNDWCDDWVTFFRDRRLRRQLDLAEQNGFGGHLQERGRALLDCVGDFFRDYRPTPALLHGDLWGGNRLTDEREQPVIFDPAVYYGDREADLAMTRLFGGYGAGFYAAYAAAWALDAGAATRTDLYNLYHVLNHLNLFGSGYLGQANTLIDGLLAQAGR